MNKNKFCYKESDKISALVISIFFYFFLLINNTVIAQSIPDIIFTQIPAGEINLSPIGNKIFSPENSLVKNSRIVSLLSGSKTPINLTPEFYSAADPDISFDGAYILFSGKMKFEDYRQIWRMKIDGSEKKQITNENGNCIMPVYAGSRFYLNDAEPTPQIIYTGNAHNWNNSLESGPVYSLYGTDEQGKTIRRITFNLYSDFYPDVLPNGRIVFSTIQLSGKNISSPFKLAFFGINIDGTDLMPFYGNHEEPVYKNSIHISDNDHRVYFIQSEKPDMLGGGKIAFVSQRRPLHSYKQITKTDDGYYHSPCPLPDGGLLASYHSGKTDDLYSIVTVNPKTRHRKDQLLKTPGWHSIDVQINAAHPLAKGRSNWLIPGSVNGIFYCLDSYQTELSRQPDIKSEELKYVRIVEGLPIANNLNNKIVEGLKTSNFLQYTPTRILGVAPIEQDGSFQVRVPAKIPLTFQLLDAHQMAVDRQETWTWVMGNENRGCIGCHENRELSPPNIFVDAVTKPAVELTAGVEKRRTVDFRNQIAPIIKKKCATSQCHISGGAKPNLEDIQVHLKNTEVYKRLLNPIQGREKESYVLPGSAKQSPLIWHIFGKRLAEDMINYSSDVTQMPTEYPLSSEEKLLFIEWIDLGAHWDLTPANFKNNQ